MGCCVYGEQLYTYCTALYSSTQNPCCMVDKNIHIDNCYSPILCHDCVSERYTTNYIGIYPQVTVSFCLYCSEMFVSAKSSSQKQMLFMWTDGILNAKHIAIVYCTCLPFTIHIKWTGKWLYMKIIFFGLF